MLFVLANDPMRISGDRRLRPHFSRIRTLAHDDQPGFIEAVTAYAAPLVLFWHEPAEPALSLLSALRRQNIWPANLKGVVLYRWANFAGVGERTRADARDALERHGLADGTVHIFALPVGDSLDDDVADLILSFVEVARGCDPDHVPPFDLLTPAEPVGMRIAVLLLDRLIRRHRDREAELSSQLDWTALRANLQEQGFVLGLTPPQRPFRAVAAQIREMGPTFLQCSGCSERGGFWHVELGQRRTGMELEEDAAHVAAVAVDVTRLIKEADSFFRGSQELLGEALRVLGLSAVHDDLMAIAAEIFDKGCPLTVASRDPACWRDIEKANRLVRTEPQTAAERLRRWLVCNVRSQGVEL